MIEFTGIKLVKIRYRFWRYKTQVSPRTWSRRANLRPWRWGKPGIILCSGQRGSRAMRNYIAGKVAIPRRSRDRLRCSLEVLFFACALVRFNAFYWVGSLPEWLWETFALLLTTEPSEGVLVWKEMLNNLQVSAAISSNTRLNSVFLWNITLILTISYLMGVFNLTRKAKTSTMGCLSLYTTPNFPIWKHGRYPVKTGQQYLE